MRNLPELPSAPSDRQVPFTDQLQLVAAAYLGRFNGSSRYHTASDLRCYLAWCAGRGLDPLAARRPHPDHHAQRRISMRWVVINVGLGASSTVTMIWACGPCLSNDCSLCTGRVLAELLAVG